MEYRLRKLAFIRILPEPVFFSYFMYCEKLKQLNCVPLQKIFTGGAIHSRSATDNSLIFKRHWLSGPKLHCEGPVIGAGQWAWDGRSIPITDASDPPDELAHSLSLFWSIHIHQHPYPNRAPVRKPLTSQLEHQPTVFPLVQT